MYINFLNCCQLVEYLCYMGGEIWFNIHCYLHTVKHVLNGCSQLDKAKSLMTNGSLMKVESIAECSNTFDLH